MAEISHTSGLKVGLCMGLVTRGRPDLLRETVGITVANITLPDTRLFVLADADDETMQGWRHDSPHVILCAKEREDCIGDKWNRMQALVDADVYMSMVDHSPCRTHGFDAKVLEAAKIFPDGIGAVYDNLACMAFPHINAATKKMVEIMGGLYPSYFPYWFVDHWFDDICRMTGRFVHADIVVDSSKRPGTQDQREPGMWATLYDALYIEREAIAEKLFREMQISGGSVDILKAQWPLVHQRSRIINDMVRSIEGTCKTMDERYLRIRAAGGQKLLSLYEQLQAA